MFEHGGAKLVSCPRAPFNFGTPRAGLRGWAIAPGPPLEGGPRDEIYLFQTKYSFEKFRDSEAIQEYNSNYVALSTKDPNSN